MDTAVKTVQRGRRRRLRWSAEYRLSEWCASWSKPPGGSRFFIRRGRVIGFFQDRHDLRFSQLRLAHGNLELRVAIVPESSPYGLPTCPESLHHRLGLQKGVEELERALETVER